MNRRQRGYTLVELMISLLLGLMLISGFGSLFSQTQKNGTVQRSLSYMMEDGRYVLEIFGKELRRTGFLRSRGSLLGNANDVFKSDPNVLGSTMSFPTPTVDTPAEYIKGVDNTTAFGDELVLRYQLNDNTELATGNSSAVNSACERTILLDAGDDPAIANEVHVVTLYFYVALDATINAPVLYCNAKREKFINNILNLTETSPNPEPLISNVQQLLITYGIDDPAVPDDPIDDPIDIITDVANYYVNADSVPDWRRVVSAKLSVVLRSEDDNLTTSPVTYTIDGDPNSPYTAADNRLYRVYSTTVAFRN